MLLIELSFPAGRYHANPWGRHVNEGVAEWPPSPFRLVRALYDVWKRKRPEWEAARVERVLAALSSSAPLFRLPQATASHTRSFLSKNEENPQSKTLIFDGFVVLSPRACVLAGWPELSLSETTLGDLDELLSLLNYLGRSESWISARVVTGISGVEWNCCPVDLTATVEDSEIVPVAVSTAPEAYQPVMVGKGRTQVELTWMDALAVGTDLIQKSGWSQPPAMEQVDYWRRTDCFDQAAPAMVETPREINSVLYSLQSKVLPKVTDTLFVGEKARKVLMGCHKKLVGGPEHVSEKFSGKTSAGQPLTGHQHAFIWPIDQNGDGRIDHIRVWCRTPFDSNETKALDRLECLQWGADGCQLRAVPVDWKRPDATAKTVVSRTPFIPVRHLKAKREDFEEWIRAEIFRECSNHGLPEPVAVTGVPELIVNGSQVIRWFEFRRNRKNDPVRSGYGVRIEFAEAVPVPFSLGYGCHFGLGQFAAAPDSA